MNIKKIFSNPKYLPYISWGFFSLAFLQTFTSFMLVVLREPLFDYVINMRATNRWVHGINPYQYPFGIDTSSIPFNYPPIGILFFAIFSQMPLKLGETIFAILSTGAFIYSFVLLNTLLNPRIKKYYLIITIGLLLLTFPFKLTLVLGQVNNFVLVFIVSSIVLYQKEKKLLSALLLAIAGLKLYPLGLLLIFGLKKDFKFIFYTLIVFLLINLIIPDLFLIYFTEVLPSLMHSLPETNYWNQSILSFYLRLTSDIAISKLLFYITLIPLLSGLIYIAIKRPLIYSIFTLLALLSITGQFSWQHHMVYAYPFILIYFKKPFKLFIIFLLFAIHLHFLNENSFILKNPFILSYQTIGLLILLSYVIVKEIRMKTIPSEIHKIPKINHPKTLL